MRSQSWIDVGRPNHPTCNGDDALVVRERDLVYLSQVNGKSAGSNIGGARPGHVAPAFYSIVTPVGGGEG